MKVRLAAGLLLALVATLALGGAASAADPVVTSIDVDAADKLTVGDRFYIVIKVEADQGTQVFLAPGGLPDVLGLGKTPTTTTRGKGDGRVEVTLTLEVAAFAPGELALPPVGLRYRTPATAGGQATAGDLQTAPSRLSVQSVLPADFAVGPRDLKPQAEIGEAPAVWVLYAFAALLVALLAIVGLLIWRQRALKRRTSTVAPEAEAVPLTAEDRARSALDRAAVVFAAEHDFVAYYSDLAVTVRDYLTTRYGFGAFALTTTELQNAMSRVGIDRWQARLVSGLLTQCDSAVYARYRPAMERADADLTAAYEIVEMSRPEPPVVEVTVT